MATRITSGGRFVRGEGEEITRIFLWRHPEVRGVSEGRVYGQKDVALTRKGERQAKAIAKFMADYELAAIYCSDLQRCRLPAELVGRRQRTRLVPTVMQELRELNLGIWEGLTLSEIEERFPGELAKRYEQLATYKIEEGESLTELAERVVPVFQEIVAANKGKQVCVISHAGVNRVFICRIMGAPLERVFRIDQEFACLNIIDVFSDGMPVIRRLNHLIEGL